MKANKPMRAAGILLLATMLTTCMTAGTFAKYTTSASATDSARVAKFGVTVQADGTLYGEEYNAVGTADNQNGIIAYSDAANTGTVQVSTKGEDVVAPGTKNTTGLGFSVNGKPEVDVTVTSTLETESIYLKQGTYGVMVEAPTVTEVNFTADKYYTYDDATKAYTKATAFVNGATYYTVNDKAVLTEDYYPVIYTLTGDTSYDSGTTATDSLAAIKTLLENELPATETYQANTDLKTELKLGSEVLTWEWAFEQNNAADTILGDLAAEVAVVKTTDDGATYTAPVEDTDYNLDTNFNIEITVTQVD